MSVRTLVFEPEARDKVMVELWEDGSVTIAFKVMDRWGIKWEPVIDDDGDHIRTSDEFAARLLTAAEVLAREDAEEHRR